MRNAIELLIAFLAAWRTDMGPIAFPVLQIWRSVSLGPLSEVASFSQASQRLTKKSCGFD